MKALSYAEVAAGSYPLVESTSTTLQSPTGKLRKEVVIPANAGIQGDIPGCLLKATWIPAFAGMTAFFPAARVGAAGITLRRRGARCRRRGASFLAAVVLSALGWLLSPQTAHGQACFGNTVAPGRVALELGSELGPTGGAYSAALMGQPLRRLSLAGHYKFMVADTLDNYATELGARAAVPVSRWGVTVCPFAGFEYTHFTEPAVVLDWLGVVLGMNQEVVTRRRIPAGVAAALDFGITEDLRVIPSATFSSVWDWKSSTIFDTVETTTRSWYRSAGVTAVFRQAYARIAFAYLGTHKAEPKTLLHFGISTR